MLKDQIREIIDKYYNKIDDCYNSIRYDNGENEFHIKEEMQELLRNENVEFKIEVVSGYSNCAYDSEFLAVSWVESGKLDMYTILLEQY